MKTKYFASIILLILLLFVVAVVSIMVGSISLPIKDILSSDFRSILILRLSRVALAGIAGASLAVVGAILQGLLRNPLADPYVIGVSSGAGLAAVGAIVLGVATVSWGHLWLPLFAFLGGMLAISFIYIISKKGSRVGVEDLLLSGVIVSAILSSFIMFIVSVMETEDLHSAIWWLLGNTQIFDIRILFVVGLICLGGIFMGWLFARSLDIMSLGEEEAITMGLNVERIKLLFFVVSSLITACVVSVCGLIGFVGLIIPHITRRLVGPGHRRLIPACALSGAIFLILSDILARKIIAPSELPIGVITAIIGGPFFILLLKRARKPQYR